MLEQVVQAIGWLDANDRDTIIRREQLEQAIPSLQAMQQDLITLGGRGVRKYIEQKGTGVPFKKDHYHTIHVMTYPSGCCASRHRASSSGGVKLWLLVWQKNSDFAGKHGGR